MILSPAERSYLYDSLALDPPVRSDARPAYQLRLLEATTAFLPASNGSARIRLMDGSECIVSVKAKVVLISREPNLIECDIDVDKHKDNSNYVSNLKFGLTNLLQLNFPVHLLKLTSKYAFKLYIDCIVISHTSYPLSLISLATYLALKTTRLPLLVSDADDAEVAELPTFADDWDQSRYFGEILGDFNQFLPPIVVTLGLVGNNLLIDPSIEEEQVLENALLVSFHQDKVIFPISNMNLATNSNNSNFLGLSQSLVLNSVSLCNKFCGKIIQALDSLAQADIKSGLGSIF